MDQADARAQALASSGGERPGTLSEQLDFAAVRLERRGQQSQQGGLASTGRADDGNALAGCDLHVDALQRHLAAGVGMVHAGELQRWALHADVARYLLGLQAVHGRRSDGVT